MANTMNQLCFVKPGQLEWQEALAPRVEEAGEAIVHPIAVASCDLDAGIVRGRAPIPGPFSMGHEFVAEVVDVGDGVSVARPGDRVVVPFQVSCGECRFCVRGATAHCSTARRGRGAAMYGIGPSGGDHGGAFSDSVKVPFADAMLVPVSDALPLEAIASASDNVADGWRTVAPGLSELTGSPVLVLNGGLAGSIGLYAVSAALALGASTVHYFDRDSERVDTARRLGAIGQTVVDWPDSLGIFPIAVDCTQDVGGLNCAVRSTEPSGFCTSASIFYASGTPVPMLDMYFRGVGLRTGLVNSRAVLPRVLDLISSGRLDPAPINSRVVDWKDAADALTEYTTKLVVLRTGE